jgi:ElaB/YqjD/DUF883 family membrane-anchored ribosome-binding protein
MNTELNALEGMKDTLVKDLKGVVVNADHLLKEAASSTSEGFAAACDKIEGALDDAKSSLDHARVSVSRQVCHGADATCEYLGDNPWKVLGVVAAVGLVIGFLYSRR